MPSRVNPAAAALLAGGLSVSALLLFIYLRKCSSNSRPNRPSKPSESAAGAHKSESSSVGQTPVQQQEEEEEEEEIVPAVAAWTLATAVAKDPEPACLVAEKVDVVLSAAAAAAAAAEAEESVSECEYQLEEDQVVVQAEEEEEEANQLAEEKEEMSASAPQQLDDAVKEQQQQPPGCTNNNNGDSVVNKNSSSSITTCTVAVTSDAPVDASETTAAAAGGGDRVSHWLAKNERFSRQNGEQPHQASQTQPQPHHCEVASDDSGRPSSVDTAGDAASSPRAGAAAAAGANFGHRQRRFQQQSQQQQSAASSSTSTAVAIAASLSQSAGNGGANGNGTGTNGTAIGRANRSSNSISSVNSSCLLAPDRSNVIRGVSPVPGDDNDVIHQFLIPNKLGGSMVGTRGRNINYIRAKSGASVWISRNFFDKKTQVVNVRGPVECVKAALQVIKKRFPELDVKPINTAVPLQRNPALQPTMCQLSLPVGALVDVNVCAMCRGTTVFLQQPTHPSFHHLEKMDYTIMKHYADQASVPALPRPVNPGAVCVAPFGTAWYRSIIADVYPEEDSVLMKYLDWGGYERMPVGCLKQIRTEMMHLPFQAVEGHLAYVSPVLSADEEPEAQLEQLSRTLHERFLSGPGKRVKAQVVYFNDVSQPCVYLYTRDAEAEAWRFLQEDLVQAGLVQWFQMPHLPPQIPQA